MKVSAGVALVLALSAASSRDARPISREAYLMGTRTTLATYDEDRARGVRRLEALLQALERTDAQLSTWRADSEVSRLNAAAGSGPAPLSPSLCAQFAVLDRVVRAAGGAFDPAIGALADAWNVHGAGRIPTAAELNAARSRSGWTLVRFDSHACTIAPPQGVAIDVGGFGKGQALDRARDAVAHEGAAWLVDLGGQVAVAGAPPGQTGWDISVAHPGRRQEPALRLTLASGSLATSAGTERDLVVDGRRVGHILDPRTGRPVPFTGSVTVWHERALEADALSTALYVMGPDAGIQWADARDVAACYLVPDGVRVRARPSRAFAARFAAEPVTAP